MSTSLLYLVVARFKVVHKIISQVFGFVQVGDSYYYVIARSVDDIDLYTGALAEDPKGRLLGPTLTCLVADQFLRIKVGDRYWYETSDPDIKFTPGKRVPFLTYEYRAT